MAKTRELSTAFVNAAANVSKVVAKEMLSAAKAHRVRVDAERIALASRPRSTVVHAPLLGINKYKPADFAAGAPVLLVITRSAVRGAIPSGSYVVKAQYTAPTKSGKAIIINQEGVVVAQRKLLVRTRAQSAVLFPNAYLDLPSADIPVITSWHVMMGNPPKEYVDCTGWNPVHTLYFEWTG